MTNEEGKSTDVPKYTIKYPSIKTVRWAFFNTSRWMAALTANTGICAASPQLTGVSELDLSVMFVVFVDFWSIVNVISDSLLCGTAEAV